MYHKLNEFSNKQAITGIAVSTNVINTGAAKLGDGAPIGVEVFVTTDFAGGTNMAIQVCDCATENGTFVMRQQSAEIPLSALVKGEAPLYKAVLPAGLAQFIQLNYMVTGTMTAGAVTAYLVDAVR